MSRTDLNDSPVPGDRPQNALASRQLVVEPLRSLECRRVNSFNERTQWTISKNSSKFNYDFELTFSSIFSIITSELGVCVCVCVFLFTSRSVYC